MTFSSGPGMITARDNKESGRAPSVSYVSLISSVGLTRPS